MIQPEAIPWQAVLGSRLRLLVGRSNHNIFETNLLIGDAAHENAAPVFYEIAIIITGYLIKLYRFVWDPDSRVASKV